MLVSWPNGKKTSRQEACVNSCSTLTKSLLWSLVYLLKITASSKTWKPLSLSVVTVTLTTTVCSRNNSKTDGISKHHRNSSFSDLLWAPRLVEAKGPTSELRLKQTLSLSDGAPNYSISKENKYILNSNQVSAEVFRSKTKLVFVILNVLEKVDEFIKND